jgi:hypothetical protein
MRYGGLLWVTVQQSLYRVFGTIGAFIEGGALFAVAVLVFLVRAHRPAFALTLVGTACPAVAFAAWVALIAPVNAAVSRWTPESVPAEWTRLRARWEYTHAARAILQLTGLGALVLSILLETPAERTRVD